MNDSKKPQDSLKKRYFFKLTGNFASLGIGFITSAIIPRGLGPGAYGDFNFLVNFFNQVVSFFDMGTSTAFYTKLSQRPKERKLLSFYLRYMSLVLLIVAVLVILARATGVYINLWPGQSLLYIYLAVFLAFFMWFANILGQVMDAYCLTTYAEVGKIFQKILGLFMIVAIFLLHNLNIFTLFIYNYFVLLMLMVIFLQIMKQGKYLDAQDYRMEPLDAKNYAKEFYGYCHPLFVYGIIGVACNILDRWLLQIFSGSVQQGYYGLSSNIGTVCFLFTGAMTPLIMREFSIDYGNKNLALIANRFRKHVPILHTITAFMVCFIAVNASKVAVIMGGRKFEAATASVAVLTFYPIYQTYGQIMGSLFYATGQTRLYRNIGVVTLLVGLPLSFWLMAPRQFHGLNLGAAGLAIKTTATAILAINIQLWFNNRFLKLSFPKFFFHQFYSVIILSGMSWAVTFLTGLVVKNILLGLLISGFFYTAAFAFILFVTPSVFLIERSELISLLGNVGLNIRRER